MILPPPFLSAPDWHLGGVVENDRDESRTARLLTLSLGDRHPPDCTCQARSCMQDRSGLSDAEAAS